MTQYLFGTGDLFTTGQDGSSPNKFGALQDVTIDLSADVKMLHGQFQFPLDVARGKAKVEGKAATGDVDVNSFNTFYFGGTPATGQELRANNEPQTIPATPGPYTVVADEAATFVQDLGVYFADTGVPLQQVASTPATGQYSVDSTTGTYTFAAADEGLDVLLNYLYGDTGGNTLVINNQLMGLTPKFRLIATQLYGGKTFTLVLYSCVAEKLSLPLKQDDYTIADFSFQAQANAAGQVGYITTTGGA